jgi:thiol:disulfide interchange protein
MRFTIFTLSFLLSVLLLAPFSNNTAAQDDMIEWQDYKIGMEKAENEDIPVLLYFYTDWCSYCKLMEENTYSDDGVIAESRSFVAIKVEAEKEADVSKNYDIKGYPTTYFLMPDGAVISKIVGYTEAEPFLDEMAQAMKYFNENKDASALEGDTEENESRSDDSRPVGIYFIVGFIAAFLVMIVVLSKMKSD